MTLSPSQICLNNVTKAENATYSNSFINTFHCLGQLGKQLCKAQMCFVFFPFASEFCILTHIARQVSNQNL